MPSLEELRKVRLEKLQRLRQAGVDPYPAHTDRSHTIAAVRAGFAEFESGKVKLTIAGRIRSVREHGEICFADLEDGTGKLQLLLNPETLRQPTVKDFVDLFDIGDFAEATGTAITTKTGELTLATSEVRLLTKSLRPLPEKWHGLTDIEERLRRRYLDLVVNANERELFRKKAKFWQATREFLLQKGFLEVETPVLEQVPGGADAEPFVTHLNALDIDLYLRISPELHLKRLIVGGYEKVFEIGRIFRNEGMDREHLQDYTQMEFYWAYADYEDLRKFVQEMYQYVIKETLGTLKATYQNQEIDWSGNWSEVEFYDLFNENFGFRPGEPRKVVQEALIKYGLDPDSPKGWDLLYKKVIRPKLIQPRFLVRPPVEMEPLAKRDPNDSRRVLRLQVVAAGTELGKGFSELNDPDDQRKRFQDQMALREAGDKEAQMLDEDFLEALEYGMPPTAGFGFSERLFAVLMDKSVREAVLFPLMKPRE
ncbi:lysine--tRNA ligase [Candidatus Parcubacteria bacterium]|nr:lysine--tRNA ligase [Candidatus Parcubacteria bacterium]